ncbi:MAG: SWIM zinc finger family protein [Nitriliruptoraceae bacterium]
MSARTRFGLTWWGKRWIEALESLGAVYANRLPRGRTYARKGTVQDLTVDAGTVTARVQGSRARPYRVQVQLPAFDDGTWEAITTALASRVRLSADLLDATMPEDIDEVLAECGVSLFPTARELTTRCSCPDVANPCKHVAAVHYVLAQTFDADPFLLTTLRGRDREALLAGLRAQRAGTPLTERTAETTDDPIPVDALRAKELFGAAGSLADIAVRPHRPDDPGAVLRRLGPPPGLEAASGELQAAVSDAAAVAWELLDSDHGDGTERPTSAIEG